VMDPGESCPDCGGDLRLVGEDVAEILDLVAAQLTVTETARLKKSCRRCERMVQPPAPSRPIPRGLAGPGLLAHILVAIGHLEKCGSAGRFGPARAPDDR